jgi:hypothetical protein
MMVWQCINASNLHLQRKTALLSQNCVGRLANGQFYRLPLATDLWGEGIACLFLRLLQLYWKLPLTVT